MTAWSSDFMGRDAYLVPRTIGEQLAVMVRRRWPRDTAKQVARAWELDPKTAKNVTEGHVSERTITKALTAEGWELLDKLGEVVTGQSYAEWQEQKLKKVLEEAERVQSNVTRLLERRQQLDQQTADLQRALDSERTAERRAR